MHHNAMWRRVWDCGAGRHWVPQVVVNFTKSKHHKEHHMLWCFDLVKFTTYLSLSGELDALHGQTLHLR